MYRDGEEGHIGVRIEGDMEFNNRRNLCAHNESQVVIDYLSIYLRPRCRRRRRRRPSLLLRLPTDSFYIG